MVSYSIVYILPKFIAGKTGCMVGRAYTYKCSRCSYEERLKQGHGYLVKPQSFEEYRENPRKLFHYEIHNKILKLSRDHPAMEINATFQVYRCRKCNLLHNKIQVTIYDGEALLHINRFKCTLCRTRLKLTNIHRLKTATCPACGKPKFRRQSSDDLFNRKARKTSLPKE